MKGYFYPALMGSKNPTSLKITKTIAREGIVMGFKKLTTKKRKKKTTRLPAKRGKSSKRK
ncbi:hypothetical protein DN389_10220 [Bacillus sp. AY3-1]|nr:hypothetical protein DN389_10220 [Bacillus sp. AY3-1]